MKNLKKFLFKTLIFICVVALGFYVLIFGIKNAKTFQIYNKNTVETKLYTILHVETFEGGGKSRISYLKNIAKSIEKNNPGVLFMFKQVEPEDFENELKHNNYHIISFGYGLGEIAIEYLSEFDKTYNVRDELIESGKFNNKLYALPYIMSGYAYLKHSANSDKLIIGQNPYVTPKKLLDDTITNVCYEESQYEAYKKFIYNKDNSLLGTARDVFRVSNLNDLGRTNAMIEPALGYTDLIQYIGICSHDDIVEKFIQSVFDDENQIKLVNYSLFPVKFNKIYTQGIYNDMENAIMSAQIPRCFYD